MLQQLHDAGITNARFDIGLMRGFDYYTGIVFEVFDTHPDNNRSMLGGGRYDGLVGLFGVQPVPTVGFGWGDVTLANFLALHKLLPELPPETDVYVALVGEVADSAEQPIAELRAAGLNIAVDYSGRKLGDQFRTAEKKGVARVVIIGEQELRDNVFKLKNLQDSQEASYSLADLISSLRAS